VQYISSDGEEVLAVRQIVTLRAWCLSFCLLHWWIMITYCNKKWKWLCARIDWCLGCLHAQADLNCGIL